MTIIVDDTSKHILIFCKIGITDTFRNTLKVHHKGYSITVVLKDYPKKA